MKNAHLRLGLLEYVRITEKTSTRIRLRVDRYIGEDRQAHLLSVFGNDSDVGAITAAVHEKATFSLTFPKRSRGSAIENNKRQLHSISLYGRFLELTELRPGAYAPYSVPPSEEATVNYRGLPYDLLEDLLPQSGAWRQVAPLLMPREDVATWPSRHASAWRPCRASVYSGAAERSLRRGREQAHRPLAVGQACDHLCRRGWRRPDHSSSGTLDQ